MFLRNSLGGRGKRARETGEYRRRHRQVPLPPPNHNPGGWRLTKSARTHVQTTAPTPETRNRTCGRVSAHIQSDCILHILKSVWQTTVRCNNRVFCFDDIESPIYTNYIDLHIYTYKFASLVYPVKKNNRNLVSTVLVAIPIGQLCLKIFLLLVSSYRCAFSSI